MEKKRTVGSQTVIRASLSLSVAAPGPPAILPVPRDRACIPLQFTGDDPGMARGQDSRPASADRIREQVIGVCGPDSEVCGRHVQSMDTAFRLWVQAPAECGKG